MVTTAVRPFSGLDDAQLLALAEGWAEGDSQAADYSVLSRQPNSTPSPSTACPDSRWALLGCGTGDGQQRWSYVACGLKRCPPCGELKAKGDAERIAFGVLALWPACLMVLTFPDDISKCPAHKGGPLEAECKRCKAQGVDQKNKFLQRLRALNVSMGPIATTFERHASGALHINLVITRWEAVDQAVLEAMWKGRVWVSWVGNGSQVASEVTRGRHKERAVGVLAKYLTKVSQTVFTGRSVSFSPPVKDKEGNVIREGWPELPERPVTQREVKPHRLVPSDADVYERKIVMEARVLIPDPHAPSLLYDSAKFPEPCEHFRSKFDPDAWEGMMRDAWAEARANVKHPAEPWKDAGSSLIVSQKALKRYGRELLAWKKANDGVIAKYSLKRLLAIQAELDGQV